MIYTDRQTNRHIHLILRLESFEHLCCKRRDAGRISVWELRAPVCLPSSHSVCSVRGRYCTCGLFQSRRYVRSFLLYKIPVSHMQSVSLAGTRKFDQKIRKELLKCWCVNMMEMESRLPHSCVELLLHSNAKEYVFLVVSLHKFACKNPEKMHKKAFFSRVWVL